MRKIKTIDDITKDGKVEFGEGYEFVSTAEEADAILMRSTDLHGYGLPEGIRAIARCGAGVNNIPVEEYAKKGVVVFNSPGANSNAVKELVLVLSSRGVVQSMNWVRDNADDPEIQVDAEKAKKAFVGRELKGKRIGVIGLGNVGSKVANACVDLGMDVYGFDPFISVEHAWVLSREVQRVGTLAFAKCSQLERVRIEPGVVQLGPSCFSKCAALKRVEMPASVTQIGGGAFFGCSKELRLYGAEEAPAAQYARLNGLTFDFQSWKDDEELVLREEEDGTLTVLGARQTAPHRIEIPTEICGRRVAAIAPKAFFASGTLEQLVVGGGVREIGESAFFGCRQLVSVSFERGLEQLKDSAFAGCESLTQVTLPWGTSAVGRMAFFGCTRLSFVKMPTTTRVSDFAFDGCAPGIRVFGGVYAGRMNPIGE